MCGFHHQSQDADCPISLSFPFCLPPPPVHTCTHFVASLSNYWNGNLTLEYHSEMLVHCSDTIMCCVIATSRQCSSGRMLGCAHAPLIDNKVDIIFCSDVIISFWTEKNPDSPPPPFSNAPTLHWTGCDFKNIHPQSASCSYTCNHAVKRGWLAVVCVCVCVTDPKEKNSPDSGISVSTQTLKWNRDTRARTCFLADTSLYPLVDNSYLLKATVHTLSSSFSPPYSLTLETLSGD